jgi:hypothetical protein
MDLLQEMRRNYIFQNESMEYIQKEVDALGGLLSYWTIIANKLLLTLQNSVGLFGDCNIDWKHESILSHRCGSLDRDNVIVANNLGVEWKNNQHQLLHAPAFIAKGGLDWTDTTHITDDMDGPLIRMLPTLRQYDLVSELDVQLLKTSLHSVKLSNRSKSCRSMRTHWAKQGFLPDQGGLDGCELEHYDEECHRKEAVTDEQKWKRVRGSH